MIEIKSHKSFCFLFSGIEENNVSRLPKSGVRIIPGIKKKYTDELIKKHKNKPNSQGLFRVDILVYKGEQDNLGKGDLDNYSKAILDIITESKTIWKDDKQVDELHVIRKKTNTKSKIMVIINELKPIK